MISAATARAPWPKASSSKQPGDRAAHRRLRDLVGCQRQRRARADAARGVAELVRGLGQAELGAALGEGPEERPRPRVRDHDRTVPEHRGLVDPALDGDVGRLLAEGRRVAVRSDRDQETHWQCGHRVDRRAQHRGAVLHGAEGQVDLRGRPVVSEVVGRHRGRASASPTGRSGCGTADVVRAPPTAPTAGRCRGRAR